MEIKAYLRHLHIAPRKVRAVSHLIKGMSVTRAERELTHRVRRASDPLRKLLRSAIANAMHDFHLDESGLWVKEMRVDPGPVTTRFRPRAFGRAAPIRRRTSHVSLVLETKASAVARADEEAPVLREATREDLRQIPVRPEKTDTSDKTKPWKAKSPPFIRRMFQRKAI